MDSPFHPSLVTDTVTRTSATTRSGATLIRWVLYSHIVGIVLAAGFSYADIYRTPETRVIERVCTPFIFAAILSLPICPVLMVFALTRFNAGVERKLGVFLLEVVLVAVHLFVLLPTYT